MMCRCSKPLCCVSLLLPLILNGFAAWPVRAAEVADKPLGHQDKMVLKAAAASLDQAEGLLESAERESGSWKAGDADVTADKVKSVLATREKCAQHLKSARANLDKLPPKHAEVVPEVKRHEELGRKLALLGKKAEAAEKGLGAVAEQAKTPQYKLDFERLREINLMVNGSPPSALLRNNPIDAAELVKLAAPMKAERKRIAEKYADVLKQDTAEAEQMRAALKNCEQVFGDLDKAVADFVSTAPAEIELAVDDANKLALQAVAAHKPEVFTDAGGIQQKVSIAEQRLAILAAADPDGPRAKLAQMKIAKLKSDIAQIGKPMRADIIAANAVPADAFTGADAEVLRMIVKQKWQADGAGSPVLKVGLSSPGWQRQTRWEWNLTSKTFEKADRSRAQGFVVVPIDPETAAMHYVNLTKDHLAADSVKATFAENPKDEPRIGRLVLLKNVK